MQKSRSGAIHAARFVRIPPILFFRENDQDHPGCDIPYFMLRSQISELASEEVNSKIIS